MNILVLTNLYPPHYEGGYELHCETVVKALQARGHTVEVLTSDHGVGEGTPSPEQGISRRLQIHGLFGKPWLGIQKLAELEKHNNDVLRETLQRVRPELIYIWSFSGLSKSMLFTLQRTGIPRVLAVCDHWIARSSKADVWLRWWNERSVPLPKRLLRLGWTLSGHRRRFHQIAPTYPTNRLRFPRIYFCSRSLRDFTAAAGYNVHHGGVIYCPLNTDRFTSKPKPASAPLLRLLYVGRLNQDKGVMTALRAMALLRDKFPGSLSIYGRGETDEFETSLKAYVAKEKLPVTFCSPLTPEQMPSVYATHDALLFTSEWPEPFALTPLEAMASGLPVIGTMTGGSPELFRHRENALTYTAGDPAELAQRILELDANGLLREQIAYAGYHEVRLRFAEPVIINQIEEYLHETVACWRQFTGEGISK
jgi:glycogen(starch) synthase